MDLEIFRINPGADLKKELVNKTLLKQKSAFLIGGIGSLSKLNIRFADEKITKSLPGPFEVCSMQGTLSESGVHIHIVVSNKDGNVLGGHLSEGSLIYTTAECFIVWLSDISLTREYDSHTGFSELVVNKKKVAE